MQSNVVGMTTDQRRLVEEEDKYRRLFAEDPRSRELDDPHLLLDDVFSLDPSQWTFEDEDADEKRVAKLLEQNRQPVAFGRAIVDTKEQFMTNWETFTKGMFKGIQWDNIFIAGGAVLACLQPDGLTKYANSDIDIFVHGIHDEDQANRLLKHIHATVKANTQGEGVVIRTRRTVTIINSFPYRHTQIILRLYKSPAQVLLGFDVDCCTFGFDGNKVWAMERGRRALTKRYNLVNPSRRSLTYESRLYKYSKRGFAVAVPDLDRSRINPALLGPTATPSQFQGLAKLIVYDNRLSNPVPFYGRGRKAQEQADEAKSDYDGDLVIPWGPGLTAKDVLHKLNATDKSQFFANKIKDLKAGKAAVSTTHKHLFVPGLDDLIEGQFWCSTCAQKVDLPEEEPLGVFVQRKVEWDHRALSYQDLDNGFKRSPLFTGSFQTQLQEDWAAGAYGTGTTSVSSFQQMPSASAYVPSRSPAKQPVVSPAKKSSPVRTPTKKAPISISPLTPPTALPSFGSYGHTAPSPAKKITATGEGEYECTCGAVFFSQNQLYRHVRVTGHIMKAEVPAAAPTSASSYLSVPSQTSAFVQSVSASPPRSPAPATIPISPSQIYSAPTLVETSTPLDISQFGPQPGGDIFFTLPSSSSSSTVSSGFSYSLDDYSPVAPSTPPQYDIPTVAPSFSAVSYSNPPVASHDTSASGSLPWEGKTVSDDMTKALLLLSSLSRSHKISTDERTVLKKLAVQGNEVLLAAVQVFEFERDEEDLLHTLQRLSLHHS